MEDYIIYEIDKKETWFVERYDYDGHVYLTSNIDEVKLFGKREAELIAEKVGMLFIKFLFYTRGD